MWEYLCWWCWHGYIGLKMQAEDVVSPSLPSPLVPSSSIDGLNFFHYRYIQSPSYYKCFYDSTKYCYRRRVERPFKNCMRLMFQFCAKTRRRNFFPKPRGSHRRHPWAYIYKLGSYTFIKFVMNRSKFPFLKFKKKMPKIKHYTVWRIHKTYIICT